MSLIKCLVNTMPTGIAASLHVIPDHISYSLIAKVLNVVFREERQHHELDFLVGKSIKIDVTDIRFSFAITLENNQFVVTNSSTADTVFKGGFNKFVLLAGQQTDPDMLFFNRDLVISGNTELSLEVKGIIENFDRSRLPKQLNQILITHCQLILE
ncbi:ubiquinone anaerobic biosynthesis accessory factor UbiT [Pseudoalteromonas sp. SSM20]|uniref:ubiquinone anaerobic biosynthesis accessory factor UbiT n=1 Tax=Pseudoalteromonas sp. SSM20 TaxID=3139394 RepID=UPI003BAB3C04